MKLFQKLLLSPLAIGLLAPLATNAAGVNLDDVANYANSTKQPQATISSQFSDVVPGDWAYTALLNLSESYGCIDNAYTQNLKSGQALTRYEAAALINACLDSGIATAEVSADATRLTNEFGTEMAILKGRVDGLEYKVKELSAGQFSPNTKMKGTVAFNTGYLHTDATAGTAATEHNIHMQYDARYDIKTSFSGKDQLYTRLRTGNGSGPFEDTTTGTHLSKSNSNASTLKVDKIWYKFPIGDDISAWVGPLIENTHMLASKPSIYKPVTKQFAMGGMGSTYGTSTSQGFGFAWTQPTASRSDASLSASTNWTSSGGNDATKGMLTDESDNKWLSQVAYGSSQWQVSAALAKHNSTNGSTKDWGGFYNTTQAGTLTGNQESYALRASWKPEEASRAIPSAIQLGYDWSTVEDTGAAGATEKTSGYMVGLMWDDVFIDGNKAGVAFGSPEHASEQVAGGTADETPFAWEAYYNYKVNDGMTITPAIFGFTDRDGTTNASGDGFGGLIQTTFKF